MRLIRYLAMERFSKNQWRLRLIFFLIVFFWIYIYITENLSHALNLILAGLAVGSINIISRSFGIDEKFDKDCDIDVPEKIIRWAYISSFLLMTGLIFYEIIITAFYIIIN